MPSHTSGSRPTGIRRRQHHTQPYNCGQARHYYSNGSWHNPYAARESCYSDFVPCTYDERTLLTRLYKYARDFLAQTNGTFLQRPSLSNQSGSTTSSGGGRSPSDIEMISSSPSPTLHPSSTTSCSPRPSYDGAFRFPTPHSPRSFIKPPPPAAFPRHLSQSPVVGSNLHKSSVSTSSTKKATVDAGTQYSPPSVPMPDPPRKAGKRRATPSPPRQPLPPPEPTLVPQPSSKRAAEATADPQIASASSNTLPKSSSSSSSQGSSPKRARHPRPTTKLMPLQYETCDVKDLVLLISNMLLELIKFNDEIPLKDGRLTRFHSRAPPGIGVKDYLQRLTTHATLSPPILLSMVYYIDRLCALYPAFTISSLTVHRFLITSATVASKGLSDSFWTNNTYARVGGVSLKELALLELEFLWRVEWRIVPKPEVLVDYYRSLVERSEGFKIDEDSTSEKSSSKSSSRSLSSEEEIDSVESKEGKGKGKEEVQK